VVTSPTKLPVPGLGMFMMKRSCDRPMMSAAALVKPTSTGCDTRLTMPPSLKAPMSRRSTPTIRASRIESAMNSSEPAMAKGAIAAADISESITTGPVCNRWKLPNNAPTTTGSSAAYRPYTTGRPASSA
jgi:hypothetical protein